MATNRLPLFPSRMNLQVVKGRLVGAKKGYDLLKKKSDALKSKQQRLVGDIFKLKDGMGDLFKAAHLNFSQTILAAGDIRDRIIEQSKEPAITLKMKPESVAGVRIPKFDAELSELEGGSLMGISKGGENIKKCREVFLALLKQMVELATKQSQLKAVDAALKVTNRRVNALEFVVIPRLENTISYINAELDELDREDFFRLKKVQAVKALENEESYRKHEDEEKELTEVLAAMSEEDYKKMIDSAKEAAMKEGYKPESSILSQFTAPGDTDKVTEMLDFAD